MRAKFITLIGVYFKGIVMGCADVVPGVSGGTIALITGIYDRLIFAIKSFDLEALGLLKKGDIKGIWRKIDGNFLLALALGIGTSLYTLASVITFLIAEYPIQLWSFFFGLIIVSSLFVLRELRERNWLNILLVIVGAAVAFFITTMKPATDTSNLWLLFPAGFIAICAMILPGLSGAFLLLIMGQYNNMLAALKNFEVSKILVFASGCLIGLLSFARVIAYLLANFRDKTLAILAGLMIGALNEIWPWKVVIKQRLNSKGESVPFIKENVLPHTFVEKTEATDPFLLEALFFMAFGIFIVVAIERAANYIKEKDKL
jgi:putative membrane protein